jgi:CBF1 interacting corepressor
MYAPPPGLAAPEHAAGNDKSKNKINYLTVERQPGDDDAAAAFRQMLAAATNSSVAGQQDETTSGECSQTTQNVSSSGAALSGTTVEKAMPTDKELTALEKAVGRRDASSSLSLEEQIARFPQLKNAPMAKGMNATNVGVTFKPLGTQLRNVRCMVCGIWGHSRGDRECQKSGWDPFANPRTTAAAVATAGILPDSKATRQQDGSITTTHTESIDTKEDAKRRARDDSSESSSDSEDSYRRRNRRRKHHHKSHHKKSKRKRRDEDERKSSHKRRKKHSKHDKLR